MLIEKADFKYFKATPALVYQEIESRKVYIFSSTFKVAICPFMSYDDLQQWAQTNRMLFNVDKCIVWIITRQALRPVYNSLGGADFAEKDLPH